MLIQRPLTLFSALEAHHEQFAVHLHKAVLRGVENEFRFSRQLPAHPAVKGDGARVFVQHRQHRMLMLRQLFAGEVQHLLADALTPGAGRDEQMFNTARLVIHRDHAVRHILSVVQISRPALFFLLLQLVIETLRRPLGQTFLRPDAFAQVTAALRKDLRRCLELLLRLDEADILAPLPLGQLGDGVAGAPLLIQLRAAQTGALPALFAPPCVDLLVVAAQQNVGYNN